MSKTIQNILNKEMLEKEYIICGSITKMSEKLNLSTDSIRKYMKIFNIPYSKHYSGIYTCNNDFFKLDSPESFYLAGFIAADGSVQYRKYSKVLKITLSLKDIDHLDKIKTILNSTHHIKKYKVKASKLVKKELYCCELQIVNKTLVEDLKRFNIVPNKTFKYEMPLWLVNHKFINHFMRGYFDGDGTISQCGLNKNRSIKQLNFSIIGTEPFIRQYQNILINNAYLNRTKILKHHNVYKLCYSGNNTIKNIFNFLYEKDSICLTRKYKKFM